MRFDITKLPVGEMLIGFLLAALAVTFVGAFVAIEDSGGEEGEVVQGSPTPTPTEAPPSGNVFEVAMVPTIKFDLEEVELPAGTEVTVRADNRDGSVLHNWAAYTDDSATELIAKTDLCAAPCLKDVTFTTPPTGEYFFRCDVHPTQMLGKLIVQ